MMFRWMEMQRTNTQYVVTNPCTRYMSKIDKTTSFSLELQIEC